MVRRCGDTYRTMGEGDIFDTYPFYQYFLQNYHEKFMRGEVELGGWINESDVDPM